MLASDSPYTADHNTRSTEDAKQLDGAHQQLASHGLGYARPVLLSQKLSMVATSPTRVHACQAAADASAS